MERLQKILSRAGVASRRAAEELIAQGRVSVNGETVQELGTKADASKDAIRVDDRRIKPTVESVYLLLNKPKGVVSTRSDPEGRTTVMDLVPRVPGLYPVGRLDYATEGLIILTNDGAFAERVAHPRYEVERRYHAKVKGTPSPETLLRARRGLVIEGERLAVDGARVIEPAENSWVEVRLHEGKHHEVRRLLQALGHPVEKLKRVGLGMLSAANLNVGEFRSLTPREVTSFLRGRGNTRSDKFATPSPAPFRPRTGPRPDAAPNSASGSTSTSTSMRTGSAPVLGKSLSRSGLGVTRSGAAASRRPESATRRRRPRQGP
ncbi:MAG: rRNA pseudouridine synthase [Vicinamibacteria bacterium]|nr:rRNA pseudouridine synthase [Vicinamibacteria bacterium]